MAPDGPQRYQRIAAEQVAGDEAWRDGLEDGVAEPLLDWALGLTDASLARAAIASPAPDGAALEETAWEAADQARFLLEAIAGVWRERPWDEVVDDIRPLLGPPLFDSPADGAEAVATVLSRSAVQA